MSGIKINKLEIENVKRVKAVRMEPTVNGLTVIGGKNNQGKTSVLDSIAWALGGEKYRPSQAAREGSVLPPYLHLVLNNGLVVERKGKNSSLKITDPNGEKTGQTILNDFVEQLAIDLPKFMQASSREKANILLQIIGIGNKLKELEQQETDLYNQRHAIGKNADQKTKFAKEQAYYPDVPKDLISLTELILKQQEILVKNGENQRKRNHLESIQNTVNLLRKSIEEQERKLQEMKKQYEHTFQELVVAKKSAETLQDESTAELESSIRNIEETNRKVRANLDKEKAEEDALSYKNQYDLLTRQLEDARKKKTDLLQQADLPLPGLAVEDGELLYNGHKWDSMSGSDQLRVSTAIVRKLNPNCGFVLLDKLEQMDLETLREFGAWLEQEGLQAIATRVSTGDECSIIIEDGYVAGQEEPVMNKKEWKAGMF